MFWRKGNKRGDEKEKNLTTLRGEGIIGGLDYILV